MLDNIDILKAALGNEAYVKAINENSKSQAEFINRIVQSKLISKQIIELIETASNKQIRSLLIIHLLSQKDYVNHLKGDSLLDRVTKRIAHSTPARLNAWVHQLDITVLTPAFISHLESEAAVSILCSIPHFHLLTQEQVEALLHKHLEPELIIYWMKNFSRMPNASYVLASLMKIVEVDVTEALNKLEPAHKDDVLNHIMAHLNLFHPLSKRLLTSLNTESHLILAMRLYLNGNYHHAYALFIEQVTQNLLNAKHQFSLAAIELLFSLNDSSELSKTISSTKTITNNYLKACALQGNNTPFYPNGHLNIRRMSQPMHLTDVTNECTLIKSIIKNKKNINHFEYFLIYYQGAENTVKQMLHNYLSYFGQQTPPYPKEPLQHLAFILTREELKIETRNAIFTAFLNHAALFDEFISYRLFLYDAIKTIQHFGLQGGEKNYKQIIALCNFALAKLSPESHQSLIQIAIKARHEAEIELHFSETQGFLSGLIKWLKRCWIYGWTGFFKPNRPQFVILESETAASNLSNKFPDFLEVHHQAPKELATLLAEIPKECITQNQLEMVISTLDHYSFCSPLKDELETRLKLHQLIHHLIKNKAANTELHAWLMLNLNPFIRNQFRLLELFFQEKSAQELTTLCLEIKDCSERLNYIIDELNCAIPESKQPVEKKTSPPPQTTHTTTDVPKEDPTDTVVEYANVVIDSAQKTLSVVSNWIHSSFSGGFGGLFSSSENDSSNQAKCYTPLVTAKKK